ncbi:hypothetical protein KP003_03005 [Geomonas nitrogeniifigens]|nr:hypothetical protein KP003_03005 [Geomonas nitrogeniifigens]
MIEKGFSPYQNEADCIQIAGLTIENRLDRVSVYGSIDLWKDKGGLEAAREMKRLLDHVVEQLEKSDLPDKVEMAKVETVHNPFA